MKKIVAKFNFWNFFIGLVIGIGATSFMWNAFMPNTYEMIKLYQLRGHKQLDGSFRVDAATTTPRLRK